MHSDHGDVRISLTQAQADSVLAMHVLHRQHLQMNASCDRASSAAEENIAEENIAMEAPDDDDSPEVLNQTSNIIYSVLIAHGYYYEVVKQTTAIPKPAELIVRFAEEAQLYAVQLRPNFVHHLAERTALPDNASLHICAHNPMVDPYLTELYQNFQKGVDRENLLIVIFPPLDQFNSCLLSPLAGRTRTATCTQFVATLSDFEMLLLQMTAGFILKLVFVLPIHERTNGGHTETRLAVWLSFQRVLGHENCHWPGQGIP